MSEAFRIGTRRRLAVEPWLRALLFAAALATLAYMSVAVIVAGRNGAATLPVTAATLLFAAATYLASHLLRVARLALIAANDRVSLRRLGAIHLFTAGAGLAIPFKLGDVYRAVELSAAVGGAVRAVTIIFVERMLDVGLILLLLLLAIASGPARAADYGPVLTASSAFVVLAVFAVALLPDNLRRLAGFIIRRYDGSWTVAALRRITEARAVVHGAALMIGGRYAPLIALTMLIWMFELLSMGIVMVGASADVAPLGTLISFLSAVIRGDTLLDNLPPSAAFRRIPEAMGYLVATQVPLVFAALLAGIGLFRSRIESVATLGRKVGV